MKVAHYGAMTKVPRLDATLCFVDEDRIDSKTADSEVADDKDVSDPGSDDDSDEEEEGAWDNGDIGKSSLCIALV